MMGLLARVGLGNRFIPLFVLSAVVFYFGWQFYEVQLEQYFKTQRLRPDLQGPLSNKARDFFFCCSLSMPIMVALAFFGDLERLQSRLRDLKHLFAMLAVSIGTNPAALSLKVGTVRWFSDEAKRARQRLLSKLQFLGLYVNDSRFDKWHEEISDAAIKLTGPTTQAQESMAVALGREVRFVRKMMLMWHIPGAILLLVGTFALGLLIVARFTEFVDAYAHRDAFFRQFSYVSPADGVPITTPPSDQAEVQRIVRNFVANEAIKAIVLDYYDIFDAKNPIAEFFKQIGLSNDFVQRIVGVDRVMVGAGELSSGFKLTMFSFRTALTLMMLPMVIYLLKVLGLAIEFAWLRAWRRSSRPAGG